MTTRNTKMLSAERLAKLKRRSDEDFEAWAVTREYIDALESELAALRAPVGDAEITEALSDKEIGFDDLPAHMERMIDLILRLQRERDEARADVPESCAKIVEAHGNERGGPLVSEFDRALMTLVMHKASEDSAVTAYELFVRAIRALKSKGGA